MLEKTKAAEPKVEAPVEGEEEVKATPAEATPAEATPAEATPAEATPAEATKDDKPSTD